MLELLRKRREDEDRGFTLIELMVVVLIIAILIAIAIPTFLGARKRAQDRAAQSNVRNALTAEKTHYTDTQAYTATAADLTAIEPSLDYVTSSAAMTEAKDILVTVSSTGVSVCLAAESASGTTFGVKDIATGTDAGTWYSKSGAADCSDDSKGSLSTSW